MLISTVQSIFLILNNNNQNDMNLIWDGQYTRLPRLVEHFQARHFLRDKNLNEKDEYNFLIILETLN